MIILQIINYNAKANKEEQQVVNDILSDTYNCKNEKYILTNGIYAFIPTGYYLVKETYLNGDVIYRLQRIRQYVDKYICSFKIEEENKNE